MPTTRKSNRRGKGAQAACEWRIVWPGMEGKDCVSEEDREEWQGRGDWASGSKQRVGWEVVEEWWEVVEGEGEEW